MKYFTFVFLVFFILTNQSLALPVDEDNATKLIQKQQQLRQEQQQRERDARRSIKNPESINRLDTGKNINDKGHCFNITTITLNGASILNPQEKNQLTTSYLNQCLGLPKINQLLKEITAYYMAKGYITTRAYLSQQNLSTGKLTIIVQEGVLTSFNWSKDSGLDKTQIELALPITPNDKLNLRAIEQGVDQLNRLQSNSIKTQMIPGDKPGETQLKLENKLGKRWHSSLSYNNSGQDSTGRNQAGFNLSGDNILGIADYMSINYQSDVSSKHKDESSVSNSLHFDIPYKYWNFDFDVSYFRYFSQFSAAQTKFISHGRTRSQSIRSSYLLWRDQSSKNGLRFTINRNQSQNYIEDVILDSSKKTATAKLELYREQFITSGRWLLSASYNKGLRLFGALADSDQFAGSPKAEFERFNVNFTLNKQLDLFNIPLSIDTELRGQRSSDILFGSQQFSIGGLYTVRGYKEDGLFGNSGALLRQQISYNLPDANPFKDFKYLGQWKVFLAYDVGMVRNKEPTTKNFHNLSGWALGFSSGGGLVNWSMTYAKPLDTPRGITPKSHQFDFSLSVRY